MVTPFSMTPFSCRFWNGLQAQKAAARTLAWCHSRVRGNDDSASGAVPALSRQARAGFEIVGEDSIGGPQTGANVE